MAIITKITTQEKNKDRFNIFIDSGNGEEYAFSVDSDVMIKFQLKKGMEIDEFSTMEIQYQDDIRKAYNLAVHYLSRRMRSQKEIAEYLEQKQMEEPVINEVLHKLTGQNYINDEEYAFAYVRTQMNTTDKGPEVIKTELKEKGIQGELLDRALREFTFDTQIEKASLIAEKFFKKNTKDSQRVTKQKLENLLLRKGYLYAVIHIALEESKGNKSSDDEMEALRSHGEKAHRKYSKYSGFEYEQKMKQSLFRKGFSIELIEKFLAELEL